MNRAPPGLLYLAIFNPALQPTGLPFEDDEDANEQAHILFYTSRERAVSRDRMLRHVGLAKALISFSEVFNVAEACNSVHSQSRRMSMVSPEPDFWIHACVELASTPRPAVEVAKDKSRANDKMKSQDKSNGKEQAEDKDSPVRDYHDGSVHDLAVRSNLLWGYEQFKLTHGSFASILTNLGREALELQLERFFTVWAWSWDLEAGHDFGRQFGIPLHPHHRLLTPIVDEFASQLPEEGIVLVTSPGYIIPSTKFSAAGYPPILSQHLISLYPPPNSADFLSHSSGGDAISRATSSHAAEASHSNFFRMSTMSLGFSSMKKGWPAYLTFGKGSAKKSPETLSSKPPIHSVVTKADEKRPQNEEHQDSTTNERPQLDVVLDTSALEDAILSDRSASSTRNPSPLPLSSEHEEEEEAMLPTLDAVEGDVRDEESPPALVELGSDTNQVPAAVELGSDTNQVPASVELGSDTSPVPASVEHDTDINQVPVTISHSGNTSPSSATTPSTEQDAVPEPPSPSPEFSSTTVFLAEADNVVATQRRKVFHIAKQHLTIQLIGMDSEGAQDINSLAGPSLALIDKLQTIINQQGNKGSESDKVPPSTARILETNDKYMITAPRLTLASPGFASQSEHLYNAQELLQKDLGVSEVFSRDQHPQHWHILRRGLGIDEHGSTIEGEVYMEVSRKETSLTDVDNDLISLVRRFVK